MKRYKLLKDTYDGFDAGREFIKGEDGNYVAIYEGHEGARTFGLTKQHVENNPEWFQEITDDYEGYGKRVRSWDDIEIEDIDGFYVDTISQICESTAEGPETLNEEKEDYKNVSVTENIAKSQLAQSQLSQLLVQYWGKWKPTNTQCNYNIKAGVVHGELRIIPQKSYEICFLRFPTEQMRDDFIEDHRELIISYFKMYEW